MFKHILLPTDGSELSEAAIQKGVQFAKGINAEVTGFHVILPFHIFSLRMGILEDTKGNLKVRPSNSWASLKKRRKRRV
jgi:nucleotide-binding universal stress UspA family protein